MTESKIRNLAKCTWVLAFDDIRRISPTVEKALKALASMSGMAVRHADETYEALHRPIILVLEPGATLPQSLAIRSIEIELPALEEERSDIVIHREFKAMRAGLLATICTAASAKLCAAKTAASPQVEHPQTADESSRTILPPTTPDAAFEVRQWPASIF